MTRSRAVHFASVLQAAARRAHHVRDEALSLSYQKGWVVSLGVGLVVWAAFSTLPLTAAAASGLGAMCVSIADVPSPTRHKPIELACGWLGGSLITLLVGVASRYFVPALACVAACSFVAALLHGFGRKAMPLSIGLLLPMVLTLGTPLPSVEAVYAHTAWFAAGGAVYCAWALLMARVLERRTRRLTLADALQAFADYQRARAALFDDSQNTAQGLRRMIACESSLVEALQDARELLFRQLRGPQELRLAAALVVLLDAFETVLSSHSEVERLRATPFGAPLAVVVALAGGIADHAQRVAAALRRNRVVPLPALAEAVAAARQAVSAVAGGDAHEASVAHAQSALRAVLNKLAHTAALLEQCQQVLCDDARAVRMVASINLRAFLLPARYTLGVVVGQMHWDSPIFRFALRFMLAMVCGFVLAEFLPYSRHGSWIMLTIAVTLRSSYSLSRQRRADRVVGDLVGAVLAMAVLHLAAPLAPFIVVVCVGLTRVYGLKHYQIGSTAGCVMGLLLLHFLAPGSGLLVSERIADGVLGACVAWAFCFVLPHWEARNMPRLVGEVEAAAQGYAEQAIRYAAEPNAYRLARKRMTDALAMLAGALRRMLDEPESARLDVAALERVLTGAHLLASQFASVQVLLRTHNDRFAPDWAEPLLARARERTLAALAGQVLCAQDEPLPAPEASGERILARRLWQVEHEAGNLPLAAAQARGPRPGG